MTWPMTKSFAFGLMPLLFATYIPTCAAPVRATATPQGASLGELWQNPVDLATRDLFYGPWGRDEAPDPDATYTFVAPKGHGVNPGVTVADGAGREWHVKQAPHDDEGPEGPVEVVLSRILSAVGYHQPPVYYLSSFTLRDATGVHVEPGGRFRLQSKSLENLGQWSWQQNPFVGMRPYQGLLVILLMFDSSDLKNDNNTLYRVKRPSGDVTRWYVVRDLGTALGETGRLKPKRDDPDLFTRLPYITRVKNGFVEFGYHGWHQELVRRRITPSDVQWASELLARLSDLQWSDAFRAGGYEPAVAARFEARLHQKIADGLKLADQPPVVTWRDR
jgi:hypothetical protein